MINQLLVLWIMNEGRYLSVLEHKNRVFRGVMNLWFGFLTFGHGNGVIFGTFV
jgi:hypothetical protein